MTDTRFIHCRDCNDVFRPSAHDRVTEFRMTADGYTEIVRDDCVAFLTRHARHRLETLRPTADLSARHVAGPMGGTYWQVAGGDADPLLIHAWRENVTAPMRYRVVPGRLVVASCAVEISEHDIRQDVDRALYPGVATERRLAAFVTRFKQLVWNLDPATLEIVYDLPNDPEASIAKLPQTALANLALIAGEVFDRTDAERIGARLAASVDDPDAFTVLVRQDVCVQAAS